MLPLPGPCVHGNRGSEWEGVCKGAGLHIGRCGLSTQQWQPSILGSHTSPSPSPHEDDHFRGHPLTHPTLPLTHPMPPAQSLPPGDHVQAPPVFNPLPPTLPLLVKPLPPALALLVKPLPPTRLFW